MCNCSNGCIHLKHKSKYAINVIKENGKVIAETKTFMGYVHYCEKHKEKYEGFCKENGHKSADWVRTNVVMDCFTPNETTQLLDEMKGLLNEFNKSFQN